MAQNTYIVNGHLRNCDHQSNCVTSAPSKKKSRFIPPLKYTRYIYPGALNEIIKKVVQKNFKAHLLVYGESYMHFEIMAGLFNSIDDLEILMAAKKTIHFRSCSRGGFVKLGRNRRRVEKLKKLLEEELSE